MPTPNKKSGGPIILLKTILAGSLVLLNIGTALAGETATPPPAEPETPTTTDTSQYLDDKQYSKFDVGKFLTVDGSGGAGVTQGTQAQSYFKKGGNPTAAFILQAINFIALTSASLSFLGVVVAGFLMMSSAGNENQRTKGVEILTKAIIGLVITLSAYFIVAFVQNLLFETAPK